MKKITIDPRVVKHLGKDLITSSEVAVIELIKNSIDANAKNINLRLYSNAFSANIAPNLAIQELIPKKLLQAPLLVFEDDGHGMTDDLLEKGFLTIGTDIKSGDESSLGEKGIGRLAAQRLGAALLVETASASENHTSFVFINWEDVIKGNQYVPSMEENASSPHTKLWIFNINLEDYIDNALQYEQLSLSISQPNVQVNRNLKAALNFLISPFNKKSDIKKLSGKPRDPEIRFFFDNQLIDINFPTDKLNLAESTHQFSFNSDDENHILSYSLNIKPWYIERVHRAIVKADAFKRLKKPHQFYEELFEKNKNRISNALVNCITKSELAEIFYQVLGDVYAVNGDDIKKELYEDFLRKKAQNVVNELSQISPISGTIYSFKQGSAIGDKIVIDSAFELKYIAQRYTLNELKYFLDDYNGIKLYRGSYRIGFLGNKENDWIKLQQFRTKGQQWYRFDLGNTLGYVSLVDAGQSHIQEISSRLDISENKTSEAFKLLINIVFNYLFYDLNRKANDLMKVFLSEEGLLEENIALRVKKNKNAFQEMLLRNRKMQEALKDVSLHLTEGAEFSENAVALSRVSYNYVTQKLDSISDDIKQDYSAQETTAILLSEADAQLKAIQVESYNNYKLMANGLITETITHELDSLSKTGIVPDSSTHFEFLKDYFVKASSVKTYNQHVYPIQNSYDSIAGKLEQVGNLYSFLETTFIRKGTYDEFIHQNIEVVVDSIRDNLIKTIKKDRIEIACETGKLSWFVPKGVLLHVFYNLINNSLYWIDVRRKWAQSDSTYNRNASDRIIFEEHGGDGLIIYDTGTGVAKSMEDLLFEPLQSGKPLSEGRGMGLYIVRKLLNSFGGNIELLDERNEFGNRYKFLILANTAEEA